MSRTTTVEAQWDAVLRAAARLQELVPNAVLVGGTAAAHDARHRVAFVDDHVVADLRYRFNEVLAALEETEGWVSARVKRPVLILGRLDGVETGIRNLIRRRLLDRSGAASSTGAAPSVAEPSVGAAPNVAGDSR